MRVKNVLLILLGVFVLSSCAHHSTMRGSVAMKTGENSAHVCLGDNEVKQGDKIVAYKNTCTKNLSKTKENQATGACVKEKIGEGKVTTVINEHYSEVTFDSGVPFTEGTIVEKMK